MTKLRLHIILAIACLGLLLSCAVSKTGTSPAISMKVDECDSIFVVENDDKQDTLTVITDSELKNELFDILTNDTSHDIVKFFPRISLIFRGQGKEESIGVLGDYIKGKNGTYKCPIDLEKKLRELVNQENAFINLEYGQENIVWNNKDNSFIHNYAYKSFVDKSIGNKTLTALAEAISDTTDLGHKICSKTRNLRKGDIAFILLYESQYVEPAIDLRMQFDILDDDCKLPSGLLDYLENNRDQVKSVILKKLQAK